MYYCLTRAAYSRASGAVLIETGKGGGSRERTLKQPSILVSAQLCVLFLALAEDAERPKYNITHSSRVCCFLIHLHDFSDLFAIDRKNKRTAPLHFSFSCSLHCTSGKRKGRMTV